MRKAGKKAKLAAQKTDDIIGRLKNQGYLMPEELGKVTKHGELRLKNCIKYDLGNGYRLITIKQKNNLFVLYVGTHDECHQWVVNNRELKLDVIRDRCAVFSVDTPNMPRQPEAVCRETDTDDDLEQRIENLSDRELREIFCGLVKTD